MEFKIAHISDPHLSRQYYREHLKSFKLLLRSIVDMNYDHLVISGDIVSTADPDDFYVAREVLGAMGLLDSNRLTVVPGNHDIFGGPHRAVDLTSFPQHIRSVDYRRHLDLFEEAFGEAFDGIERLLPNETFPFIKNVGPFVVIGANSMPPWSPWKNPLGTNGMLGHSQIEALQTLMNREELFRKTPIFVIHHHFNNFQDNSASNRFWKVIESKTMRMRGRRKLLKLLRLINVRFVLHGHVHRNEIYERGGICLLNGAGAVCDDPVRFLKFNDILFQDGHVWVATRQLPIPYQVSAFARSFHKFKQPLVVIEPVGQVEL